MKPATANCESSRRHNPVVTEYVVGFCFDPSLHHVVLVRKNRPEWQKGRLNGVGGHIEESDPDAKYAMDREFGEETGVWGVPVPYARQDRRLQVPLLHLLQLVV